MNKMVVAAEMLAREAHAGQFRKDGVTPYITHPERIAKFFDEIPDFAATGWLHDILEDTTTTVEQLKEAGISDRVIEAVVVMTKREGENYHEYLARVKDNDIALYVKVRDILDNFADNPSKHKAALYAWGLNYLTQFLFETQ
jgi:(p)ppGpp synthase/HD superfamily hydrolase